MTRVMLAFPERLQAKFIGQETLDLGLHLTALNALLL